MSLLLLHSYAQVVSVQPGCYGHMQVDLVGDLVYIILNELVSQEFRIIISVLKFPLV